MWNSQITGEHCCAQGAGWSWRYSPGKSNKILQLGSGGPSPQKRSRIYKRGTNQAREGCSLASKKCLEVLFFSFAIIFRSFSTRRRISSLPGLSASAFAAEKLLCHFTSSCDRQQRAQRLCSTLLIYVLEKQSGFPVKFPKASAHCCARICEHTAKEGWLHLAEVAALKGGLPSAVGDSSTIIHLLPNKPGRFIRSSTQSEAFATQSSSAELPVLLARWEVLQRSVIVLLLPSSLLWARQFCSFCLNSCTREISKQLFQNTTTAPLKQSVGGFGHPPETLCSAPAALQNNLPKKQSSKGPSASSARSHTTRSELAAFFMTASCTQTYPCTVPPCSRAAPTTSGGHDKSHSAQPLIPN